MNIVTAVDYFLLTLYFRDYCTIIER